MQSVLDFIEQKTREFAETPIVRFLRDRSIDPRQRFSFAPIMAPWAFGFADINKYVLRDASSQEPFQQIINRHTEEDDHHWGMYLKDLRTLGMNDAMDLVGAIKLLWSDECKHTRQTVYGLTSLIASASPTLRLVITEAVEALGNVGFKAFLPCAEEFEQRTGETLIYFGQAHLDLESGHAMGTDDIEGELAAITLSPEEAQEGRALVQKIFELICAMGDEFLAYAQRYPRPLPIPRAATPAVVASQAE